jgi:hypothetical protein
MSEPEGRAIDGLVHLQGAAVQLIAAARAFIDVAEDLVRDPSAAAAVVETLASLATAARAEWSGPPASDRAAPADAAHSGPAPTGAPTAKVRRIPLSDER